MTRRTPRNGFTLIELMVTITIIAIMMALAVPSISKAVRSARERGVPQKMIQDFTWARGAAGTADASVLVSGASGVPTLTLTINADCTWTTTIVSSSGTYTDATHSMTSTAMSAQNITMACTSVAPPSPVLTFPVVFTFTQQGFITNNAGNVTFTGGSGQTFPLNILLSGSVIRAGSNAS